MRSDKLILAIALTSSTVMAASTIEVTSANTPYKLTADVTDATTLSIAEGCVLDLNGHNLTYSSPYGSGLSGLSGHASMITNSVDGTSSTITIALNSTSSNLGTILSKVAFGGDLKLVVKGPGQAKANLLGNNTHTGGTVFDGYRTNDAASNQLDPNYYSRVNAAHLGSGPLTLKNGSNILVMDSIGTDLGVSAVAAANDSGNSSTNIIWLEHRVVSSAPVSVADGTTLLIASKAEYPNWSGNFTEVRGTLALFAESTGGFVVENSVGLPNAKVRFLDSTGKHQLRFGNSGSIEVPIGEISTDDEIDGSKANAVVMNSQAGTTKTIKVGGLGTSTVFNGNFTKNNTAHIALEKVGAGTLTLGGTNTYDGVTTLTEGAIKLAGLGVMGYESNANIVFNGGTLAFADDVEVTDYSARVKNSTGAVSVDTEKDVTWATALPSSNKGGVVKKGSKTLEIQGYSAYTGKTIVSNGTLKVGFEYNGTKEGLGREFEVEDGANLEVTLRNTTTTRPAANVLTAFPEGTTVNLDATAINSGYPRWGDMSGIEWSGIVNFASTSTMSTAGGFVNTDDNSLGSSSIGFGVTGAPESLARIVDFEYKENANINLGSFNWPSANAGIFVKRSGSWNIGGRNEPSVLNGKFLTNAGATLTINYTASSTLTIGDGFGAQLNDGATGTDPQIVLKMNNGTLVNNADLSGYTVVPAAGVTLSGSGTWPENMTLPARYHVAAAAPGEKPETLDLDVDFAKAALDNEPTAESVADLSKDTSYTVFTAKSIAGWANKVIASDNNGKWKLVKQGNSLVLKYSKASFVVILR